MLTQLLMHVSKEKARGEYTKRWRPGRGRFIDRGAVRGIEPGEGVEGGRGRG